jgi:hypothetical protein
MSMVLTAPPKGLCVKLSVQHPAIKPNAPVKLQIKEFGLAALGKVVWVSSSDDSTLIGLQIVSIN